MKKKKLGKGLNALLELYDDNDENVTTDAGDENIENSDKTEADKGIIMLRTSLIEPDRKQPRTNFDEDAIEQLAQSLQQHGMLQPILVRKSGESYKIVAGERRWRAAMKAGIKEVPVIVKKLDDLQSVQIALIENLQRESLDPVEEAMGYKRLSEEFSMTQEQIAEKVSKPRSVVANSLRLLELPESVQKMLSNGEISVGHAKVLAGVADKEKCAALAQKAKEEKLTVRALEALLAAESKAPQKPQAKGFVSKDPYVSELEIAMKKLTGAAVKVKQQKGGAQRLEIEFRSMEELKSFASRLAVSTEVEG